MDFLDEDYKQYLFMRQVADACITGVYLWQVWEKKDTEEVLKTCDMINDNVAKCLKEEIIKKSRCRTIKCV